MNIVVVTGASGLIGSEAVTFFAERFDRVLGIDNDSRAAYFGPDASTAWRRNALEKHAANYRHIDADIRDRAAVEHLFRDYGKDIRLVIHAAAQPSHDWAASHPFIDFEVNASATLTLLEGVRTFCPEAVFIFTSTNKVYGDRPNTLPLVELDSRWEVAPTHPYAERGIDETMSIDQCMHSLFGVSKVAADLMVQEYGRYFGLRTTVFRGGCLTGPQHSGAQLHGFLNYLVQCILRDLPYTVFGYKGKQVRDNLHSEDLVRMFWEVYRNPGRGAVYNAGGGRHSNCSVLEAIDLCERITGKRLTQRYDARPRKGDHIWWISDVSRFRGDYPDWAYRHTLEDIVGQTVDAVDRRLRGLGPAEDPAC
ncbi:MAG: NAD-dependent epimerase/dehydratase family protein [Kiritimatiellaeota bacterium]|nr:NAD-dependent epimerase/dehydratase family protein [Kiritimatiellota bacterium]